MQPEKSLPSHRNGLYESGQHPAVSNQHSVLSHGDYGLIP
jgi:hypothetical protein